MHFQSEFRALGKQGRVGPQRDRGQGVVLDYLSHEGEPIRIAFTFSRDAKILRTACAPAGQALPALRIQAD